MDPGSGFFPKSETRSTTHDYHPPLARVNACRLIEILTSIGVLTLSFQRRPLRAARSILPVASISHQSWLVLAVSALCNDTI